VVSPGEGVGRYNRPFTSTDYEGAKKWWSFISISFVRLHVVLYSLDKRLKRNQHIKSDKQQAEDPVQVTAAYQKLSAQHSHISAVQTKRPYCNRKCNNSCEQDTH
jgi:hypothetical protein